MNRIGSEFIHAGIRHPDNPKKNGPPQGSYRPAAPVFIGHGFRIPEQQLFGVQPEFHAPRPARGDRPETSASGSGMFGALVVHDCGSGSIRDPARVVPIVSKSSVVDS
jgi:hypothetical protein